MTSWTWKCTHVHVPVYKTDIAFEKFNKIKGKNSILTHNLHSSLKNRQYCLFLLRCCLLYSLSIKYCKYIVGITIRLYQFFCDFFFYQSVGCVCLMFAKLNFQTKLTIKYECLSYIFLKPQFYFIKTLKHTCKFHVTNILEHKLKRIIFIILRKEKVLKDALLTNCFTESVSSCILLFILFSISSDLLRASTMTKTKLFMISILRGHWKMALKL